ncbi:MAG: hypothetical protein MUD08_06575 [Cytophagales bacterium]|nr:hypothetical protein [Cytophagales bacterium]
METMNVQEQELWTRLQGFGWNESTADFSFTQRLAQENRWSVGYAQRVVDEYKRFLFLACVAGTQVTPSDAVDQAWHLHLSYTKSYWQDLCRDTLNREIHHNPTNGGTQETQKFKDCYEETLQLYKEKFGEYPPDDIWQPTALRFTDTDFVRVNRSRNWILQKPVQLSKKTALLGVSLLVVPASAGMLLGIFIAVVAFAILFIVLIRSMDGTRRRLEQGDYLSADGGDGLTWLYTSGGGDTDSSGDGDSGGDSGGDGGSGCGSGCGGGGCGGGCGS